MYEEKEIKYKKRKKETTPKKEVVKKEEKKVKEPKKKTTTKPSTKNSKSPKKVAPKKKAPAKKKKKSKKKIQFSINIPPILKRIDYKKLITELVVLVLVMMLLIFTISRIRKHQEKLNENINNNIARVTDATIAYFEENTLPQNIGDSTSFILEEMQNLDLLPEIKDEKENTCNTIDSYIILTKTMNEEYRLKIYLKCPSKEKTVEQRLTCKDKECTVTKK